MATSTPPDLAPGAHVVFYPKALLTPGEKSMVIECGPNQRVRLTREPQPMGELVRFDLEVADVAPPTLTVSIGEPLSDFDALLTQAAVNYVHKHGHPLA
jgi:hypothetical protein